MKKILIFLFLISPSMSFASVYAQILGGYVKNTIVLSDSSLIPNFSSGFDYFIKIDNLNPQPGVGWPYDGNNFSSPPVPAIPKLYSSFNAFPVNPTEGDKGITVDTKTLWTFSNGSWVSGTIGGISINLINRFKLIETVN